MLNPIVITSIGLLAQVFFSARTLFQWIMSERAHKVLSPTIFWVFSAAGSILLAFYGYLRQDFAIVIGQFVSFYVYIWNLHIKKVPIPKLLMWILCAIPIIAICGISSDPIKFINDFFMNADIPLWLVIYGTFGQLLFTLRFVYQWWYSRKIGESELPPLFWWLSLIGASLIFSYGVIRFDIVLMLGQSFGIVVYIRNIIIGIQEKKMNSKTIA